MQNEKCVFICADHGLAIIYFLKSQVVNCLLAQGVKVVLLTQDELVEGITENYQQSGLTVVGLRYDECENYARSYHASVQWWLNFLRRVGTSDRINTEAMDSHVRQVEAELQGKQRLVLPFAKSCIRILRKSKAVRKKLIEMQMKFVPSIYSDLFAKYHPDLVVSSTYGWRNDKYLLREAKKHHVKAGTVIVGWDNPSSYGLPSAPLDFAICWSEIQKRELVEGSDWEPEKIKIGGIPSYDGYYSREWLIPQEAYYKLHGLDPKRKLIAYACSFVTFSPNLQNVVALANAVNSGKLKTPAQLLVRLHPNHFLADPLYTREREEILDLASKMPFIHVVEPVALGGNLGNYSGEDMEEKTSMMAHADVFTTVYSTMCVECAIHDKPILSVCMDTPGGWNKAHKFSLALSEIGKWPTHSRFINSKAGRVVFDGEKLIDTLNLYLSDPSLDCAEREKFVQNEITFIDGNASKHTASHILDLLK
ncbi:MAG: hypothetical protein VB108_02195 [Anaerolineaceae bacterium]|nr:hypothetical protein [Anaerolineaceae bacterium]